MLAVTGGKGGCGKTTTALGLARELARHGMTPLVVDTDTDMPDLHHLAELSREPSLDRLCEGIPLSSVIRESDRLPGVALLTAGSREHVGRGLRRAQEWQGPVIVDCPPGLGPGAIGPLRVASGALVVTTEQPTCLADARQTIRALRRVDTSPVGAVWIRRSRGQPQQAIAGCRVLGTAPFTQTPFDDESVVAVWHRVAEKIWAGSEQRTPNGQSSVSTLTRPGQEQIP